MSTHRESRIGDHVSVSDRVETLLASIAHTGQLTTERINLPGITTPIEVIRPTDINLLLDQTAGDPEQNLPYWAEIWPSGIALAAAIAQQPDLVANTNVLELGCGLGITASQAVAAGARLTICDYFAEALTLARITCLRNTGQEPCAALQLNWRALPTPANEAVSPFPVVLAADVLYEQRDVAPLVEAIERLVAVNGLLWLAEPGRPPAAAFIEQLRNRGWNVDSTRCDGPWPDANDADIIVHTHRMTRPDTYQT